MEICEISGAQAPRPLTVALTSRALFDLQEAHSVFEAEGEAGYEAHMACRLEAPLPWGAAYPLVRTLLAMNEPGKPPITEVCLVSRNHPMAGLRIMGALERAGLPIEKAIFTKGRSPLKYLRPLRADLFLSADGRDVAEALGAGYAAATILPCQVALEDLAENRELVVALDADSTLFSDEADQVFRASGVEAFHAHEREKAFRPLPPGPFADFFRKLCRTQDRLRNEGSPYSIRTALVTARAVAAHARALRTLMEWGVTVDEAHFLAGDRKAPYLAESSPTLFVDDSKVHAESASQVVPTAHVPAPARKAG